MSQTLLHLLQALLKGLIQEMGATDAAIVLPDSSERSAHLLVRVGRLDAEEWYQKLYEQPPQLLGVPLRSRATSGRVAKLYVYHPGRSRFDEATRLSTNAVAAAVDYLLDVPGENFDWMQLVASRRILSVTEEELTRIVLDIHDGPVQKLFATLNRLLHVRAMVERGQWTDQQGDGVQILPDLVGAIELLENSLGEIRTFLGAFHSTEMAEQGLLDVLEALILQYEQLTERTVRFQADAHFPAVSVPVKIAPYRILQEALSNVYRHAQVSECSVALWVEHDYIHLEVRDQGAGFVPPALDGPAATEAAQHIGLRGMRDRVYLVGGELQLDSAPGQGTRVEVRVPIS